MEEQFNVMFPCHVQDVLDHYPSCRLLERDSPSMDDRIREAQVAVVPALEDIALLRGPPQGAAGVRLPEPHEISARLRLIQTVDPQGVVGGGAAKVPTPLT